MAAGAHSGKAASELLADWAADSAAPRASLLKRSIILCKAWCFYETRILGAHHSLLSSYALEVFVLYVLLHYHHIASTPLALLCAFVEVVKGFDWDANALSLHGPVPLSTMPPPNGTTAGAPPATPVTANAQTIPSA